MEGIGLCWIWFCFSSPFAWWYIHVFIKNLWWKYLFIFFFGISDEGYNFISAFVPMSICLSHGQPILFFHLFSFLTIWQSPSNIIHSLTHWGFGGCFLYFIYLIFYLSIYSFFKLSFIYHVFIDLFLNLLIHLYN